MLTKRRVSIELCSLTCFYHTSGAEHRRDMGVWSPPKYDQVGLWAYEPVQMPQTPLPKQVWYLCCIADRFI